MAQLKTEAKQANLEEFSRVINECTHRQQGIFFLNAYWSKQNPNGEQHAEKVWNNVQMAVDLDEKESEQGIKLDEFQVCPVYGKNIKYARSVKLLCLH